MGRAGGGRPRRCRARNRRGREWRDRVSARSGQWRDRRPWSGRRRGVHAAEPSWPRRVARRCPGSCPPRAAGRSRRDRRGRRRGSRDADFRAGLEAAMPLPAPRPRTALCAGLTDDWTWIAIIGRLVSRAIISAIVEPGGGTGESIDELQLGPVIAGIFRDLGPGRRCGLAARRADQDAPPSAAFRRPWQRSRRRRAGAGAGSRARSPTSRSDPTSGSTSGKGSAGSTASRSDRFCGGWRLWTCSMPPRRPSAKAAGAAAAAGVASVAGSAVPDRLRAAEHLTATLAKAAKTAGYQLDKLEDAARA